MKYKLALDVGVGSIGTALIELDQKDRGIRLIDAGVRIFEVSEGAKKRREYRTARKNLVRKRKRLELLAKKLFENGLWVSDNPIGTKKMQVVSPYQIRRDALYGKLENPNYVGRAILHIAKYRGAGWLDEENLTEDDGTDDNSSSVASKKSASPFDKLDEGIEETNAQTVGEYLWARLQNDKAVRQKQKCNPVDYRIPRYLLEKEFDEIWKKQAEYFEQMHVNGLEKEIRSILFFERSPVPYAIGKCIYYTEEDRLPKIHSLAEERRIYEEVNNLRIITTNAKKRLLTMEERDKIVGELLMRGQSAGKQSIKRLLKIDVDIDKPIKAFLYSTSDFQNINCSNEELERFSEFLSNPVNPQDKEGRLYTEDEFIRCCAYFFHSHKEGRSYTEDEFIQVLKGEYKIGNEQEIRKLLSKLPRSGRGRLGKTATKKILEKLKEKVISHREAADELKASDWHFRAIEELSRENQGRYTQLPYYGEILRPYTQPIPPFVLKNNNELNEEERKFGKIANPGVHRILNQIRLVVNEIIQRYGRPYFINIELGRDVGLSEEQKKVLEKEQKNNEKLNEEAKGYLKEKGLEITEENILKYKLAKEQRFEDIYNPGLNLPQNFEGMEVDHIIPRERGGSDTFSNLCLVSSNSNGEKGDMFPYRYFETKRTGEFQRIMENIREIYKNKPGKLWRFEEEAEKRFVEKGDNEETNRYLADTRYVTKLALQYLRAILDYEISGDTVHTRFLAVRGKDTAFLRKCWKLQGVEYDLMGLNIPEYIDKDRSEDNKNKEWFSKPRIDHRHHAIDAIVIGCATLSLLQKIQREDKPKIPNPLLEVKSINEFRKKVIEVLKKVKVSHKSEHSKHGELHKATKRKVIHPNANTKSVITVYKREIDVLKTKKDLDKLIISDNFPDELNSEIAIDRKRQSELREAILGYWDKAKQILEEENEKKFADGKSNTKITEAKIIKKAIDLLINEGKCNGSFKCYEKSSASTSIYIERHGVAYESGNNYCMAFFKKADGKVGWEVINRFNANNPNFTPEWQKQDGNKPLWYVCSSDLLELDTPDEWKQYTNNEKCLARVKKMSRNELTIDYISDARMTSPTRKEIKYMYVDSIRGGLSFYTKHKARKIELTPFGKVRRKHKKLWNDKA